MATITLAAAAEVLTLEQTMPAPAVTAAAVMERSLETETPDQREPEVELVAEQPVTQAQMVVAAL
jgi:hypothetical protein